MTLTTIYFVTRNPGKIMAARSVFEEYNITLQPVEKEYPEIQGVSLEIAKYTAQQAAKDLQKPALREDHSLYIDGLGIPGPYTHFMEKQISAETLLKLLASIDSYSGHFEVATVYAEPGGKIVENVFTVPMTFSKEVRGENPRGWSGLIRLLDEERCISEYPESERLHIWNQGYKMIAEKIAATL